MSDIDWSKAPEGFDFYMPESCGWYEAFYRITDEGCIEKRLRQPSNQTHRSYNEERLVICGAIKRPNLVYTQEIHDAGELPSVGMECKFETTFFTTQTSNQGICEIIAYFGDKVWINIIDFDCVINTKVIDFKPLTPPIELIDGKAYQFNIRETDSVACGIYSKCDQRFHVGINQYFDLSSATNITLLTPEK